MIRLVSAAFCAVVASSPVLAEEGISRDSTSYMNTITTKPTPSFMMTLSNDGVLSGDWAAIQKCAAGSLTDFDNASPEPQVGDSDFIAKYDKWHHWEMQTSANMTMSNYCRIAIAARHAGYLSGQKTPKTPDPFAPIPWKSDLK